MSNETNRYGEPLKPLTTEEAVKSLEGLPSDLVISICAALIVTHEPFSWEEKIVLLKGEYDASQK
ncbi:MAG: hypothetical protein IT281_04875 [Ignavibacteria bacterium]|nr:hypothetical protein [Ignavibacteria bacterium]